MVLVGVSLTFYSDQMHHQSSPHFHLSLRYHHVHHAHHLLISMIVCMSQNENHNHPFQIQSQVHHRPIVDMHQCVVSRCKYQAQLQLLSSIQSFQYSSLAFLGFLQYCVKNQSSPHHSIQVELRKAFLASRVFEIRRRSLS